MRVHLADMAIITAMVLSGRSQDLLLQVSVRRAHVVFSTTVLDLRMEESLSIRHVKPLRYRDAYSKPRARDRDRT